MAGRLVVLVAVAAALAVVPVAAAEDADQLPPDGAVGGVQSRAAGVLHLSVLATDGGAGLDRASAALDGRPVADAGFEPSGAPVATVTLDVDTTAVPDGAHVLTVVVTDTAGNARTLVDQAITVANTPPEQHGSVTVTVGSGAVTGQPGGGGAGGGGVKGSESEGSCRAPRLSVALVTAPLRIRRGVPVLVRGRKYLYRGMLTCRIDGKRRAARRGTKVELRQVVGGHVASTLRLKTGRHGRFAVRLAVRTSRVLVFRVRGTNGDVLRVRIPVAVVRRARVTQVPVGGEVPSFLALALADAGTFTSFPRAGAYEKTISARVTSTDRRTALSVADEVPDGPARGRMASASDLLRAPLEARVGGGPFAALDAPVEPPLEQWTKAVANQRATVRLRQRVGRGERGDYRKTILITLSPDAP